MALISMGAIVTAIRGKVKGSVFSNTSFGQNLLNKRLPSRVQNQKRSRVNNQWKYFSQVWKQVGLTDRAAWGNYSINYTFHNKLGSPVAARRNIIFATTNLFYFQINQSILLTPLPFVTPAAMLLPDAIISVGAGTAVINWSTISADVYITSSVSPPFVLGQEKLFRSRIKSIKNIELIAAASPTFDFGGEFFSRYPLALPGQYVWVAYRKVDPTSYAYSKTTYILTQLQP